MIIYIVPNPANCLIDYTFFSLLGRSISKAQYLEIPLNRPYICTMQLTYSWTLLLRLHAHDYSAVHLHIQQKWKTLMEASLSRVNNANHLTFHMMFHYFKFLSLHQKSNIGYHITYISRYGCSSFFYWYLLHTLNNYERNPN